MKRRRGLLALLVLLGGGLLYSRPLQEVRESATLIFAVAARQDRRGRLRIVRDIHYYAALDIAAQMGLKPVFVPVKHDRLYDRDLSRRAKAFKQADIIAARTVLTPERVRHYRTIPVYPAVYTWVLTPPFNRLPPASPPPRLFRFSPLPPFLRSLLRKKGRDIRREERPFSQVLRSTKDSERIYLMPSDRALLLRTRRRGYRIRDNGFYRSLPSLTIGWLVDPAHDRLAETVTRQLTSYRQGKQFRRRWRDTFRSPYTDYRKRIDRIDHLGERYFKRALEHAFAGRYRLAAQLFEAALRRRFRPHDYLTTYERIYLRWLERTAKREPDRLYDRLAWFFHRHPTPSYIRRLKRRYHRYLPRLTQELRRKRQQQEKKRALEKVIRSQTLLCELRPAAEDLRLLYDARFLKHLGQLEKDKDGRSASVLKSYLQERSPEYFEANHFFITHLKALFPPLYREVLYDLREERDSRLDEKKLDRAMKLQRRIVALTEKDKAERENQRKIAGLMKKARRRQRRRAAVVPRRAERDTKKDSKTLTRAEKKKMERLLDTERRTVRKQDPPEKKSTPKTKPPPDTSRMTTLKKKSEKEVATYEGRRYYRTALKLYRRKQYTEALENFENALSLNYKEVSCRRYIKRIRAIERKAKAKKRRERLERYNKHYALALQHFNHNRNEKALEAVLVSLQVPVPQKRAAKSLYNRISDRLASEGAQKVARSSPYYPYYRTRMYQIDQHIKAKRYQKAKTMLTDILTLFPHNEEAKEKLVLCEVRSNPDNLRSIVDEYFERAQKQYQKKDKQEAHSTFSLVRRLMPDYPGIKEWLKKTAPAPPQLNRSYQKKGGGIDVKKTLSEALAYYRNKKMVQALRKYKEILSYYPNHQQALINKTRIENLLAFKSGRQSTTGSAVRKEARAFFLKGNFYYRTKQYRKALQYWKKAYQTDDTYRQALMNIYRVRRLLQSGG